jgi:hypothetical protein
MHHARAQRRLARMARRGEAFANKVDRLEAHVAARGTTQSGHTFAKHGGNNGLNLPSTCVFLLFLTSLSLRTMCPVERVLRKTPPARLVEALAP